MNINSDETPYNTIWGFSKVVPFKTLIKQHQDRLPLRHMVKNDMESSQKGSSSSDNIPYQGT